MADRYKHISPQLLSPEGKSVEEALEEYRSEVNFPHFITGHVDDCPALKVSIPDPEQKDVIFENPYAATGELYSRAEQSQVGTATKTVYRFDARKSKEYSSVVVLNNSWHKKVEAVCSQVGQALAPGARKVNAELYKLLIYSKEDFFNRHQDAQYSARMFATLLFFLPVKYSGGEFVLYNPIRFRGDATIIEDKKAGDGCTWVAFYTDIYHRVNQVEEGFRVVLNYCLTFEGNMTPSRLLPTFSQSTAGIIRDYFLTSDKKERSLAIPLTYKYTQATLSPTFLKGIDACLFTALEDVAITELHFVLQFEKTQLIRGSYEDDHKQVFQGVFVVKHEFAQKFSSIEEKFNKELDKLRDDRGAYNKLSTERDKEYAALSKEVKSSQQDVEWIVKRNSEGEPNWSRSVALSFEQGSLGWLGNMTPAAEYYYMSAAVVVSGSK